MMIAKYERGKKLNVRERPNPGARVVGVMLPGDAAECEQVKDGWAKLRGGYANAAYLTIEEGEACDSAVEPVRAPGDAAEPEAAPAEVAEAAPEAVVAVGAPEDDDEAEGLRKLTNPELYDLAQQSGVKVKKGTKKEDIIAALLADD